MRFRAGLVGCAMGLLSSVCSVAHAHTTPPSRQVILQLDGEGAAMLWRVEVPAREAALLWAAGDQNGDGRYDAKEELQLAGSAVARAMRDVVVLREKERWPYESVDPHLDGPRRQGALSAVALAPLERAPGEWKGSVRITVRVQRGGPLGVAVQGLAGWSVRAASQGRVAPNGVALAQPVVLREGEELTLTLERP